MMLKPSYWIVGERCGRARETYKIGVGKRASNGAPRRTLPGRFTLAEARALVEQRRCERKEAAQ